MNQKVVDKNAAFKIPSKPEGRHVRLHKTPGERGCEGLSGHYRQGGAGWLDPGAYVGKGYLAGPYRTPSLCG